MSLHKVPHNSNLISICQKICEAYRDEDCYNQPLPDDLSESLNTCILSAHRPRQEGQPAQPPSLPKNAASVTVVDTVRENLRGQLSRLSCQVIALLLCPDSQQQQAYRRAPCRSARLFLRAKRPGTAHRAAKPVHTPRIHCKRPLVACPWSSSLTAPVVPSPLFAPAAATAMAAATLHWST